MNLICLDFETYFDDDYTLKKMTTEAYIRDPRFEALGVAIQGRNSYNPTIAEWTERPDIFLGMIDWENTAVIAHHAHFDGLILSHHYGIKPAFWFDTLSMGRLVHGNHLGLSLESLASHYGLQPKCVPYDRFKGRRAQDLDDETRRLLGAGCAHDVQLTWELFGRLVRGFPKEELEIIDATVRMFTEPTLIGDTEHFRRVANEERAKKDTLLDELVITEKDLQSADTFVRLLEAEGVEVPTKEGKKGPIPAIAATDPFMKEICDDENERVATLAQARLAVRSTINETRSERLAGMSQRGPLPVYLRYCGAHTTRWGGGDRVNFQNLPRSLRGGVRAPEGHKLIRVDQSQGECRIVNWLAGQWDVIERFRNGADPYLPVASAFYGREITKADKDERQLGKVIELACGFGMGAAKLKATARNRGITLTDEQALRGRDVYRDTHSYVVAFWKEAEQMLYYLAERQDKTWGPFWIGGGCVYLPNGAWIDYTSLKYEEGEWRLKTRDGWTKIYGAKLVENVVQALSRVITSQAMLKVRRLGVRLVGTTHDDFWAIASDDDAERVAHVCEEAMAMSPVWASNLPLGAEAHVGESYAE